MAAVAPRKGCSAMQLDRLHIQGFRNIAQAELGFAPGCNLILGDNGQGKSNLLEAVGLLATGRSFRKATAAVMLGHGHPWYRLSGHSRAGGLAHTLDLVGQGGSQSVKLNGKPMTAASAMGRALAAVIIDTDALRLAAGAPAPRRAWLDWLAFFLDRAHAARARDCLLALRSRNLLLRRPVPDVRELDAWENRIADLGAALLAARHQALNHLSLPLTEHLAALGLDPARFGCHYACQLERHGVLWHDVQSAVAGYTRLLAQRRAADQRQGVTSVGPHRDDLVFTLEGRALAETASQGQRKRFVLAAKLAEGDVLRAGVGEHPLLLLDDPAADLDPDGMERLLRRVTQAPQGGEHPPQVLLTSCRRTDLPASVPVAQTLLVQEGSFTRI
ncbi:MAG: DNA replication and repair protein RecF [Magnetococcus sp. WYHC-3]